MTGAPVDGSTVIARRYCRECGQSFEVTEDERQFLMRVAEQTWGTFHLPRRCLECRTASRQVRYAPAVEDHGPDERLTCSDCQQAFTFGGRDRAFFAANGWTRPKRCRGCRQQRALRP